MECNDIHEDDKTIANEIQKLNKIEWNGMEWNGMIKTNK